MRPTLRSALAVAGLCALAAGVAAALAALGQTGEAPRPARAEASRPPLGLGASLLPSPAGAESLLRLSAVVDNRAGRPVSAFRFEVTAGGRELAAYRDTVFLAPVSPGTRRTLPLHNLWVSEAGRPPPAGGTLRVEVALVEASWVAREATPEGVQWRVLGPVEGLPVRAGAAVDVR